MSTSPAPTAKLPPRYTAAQIVRDRRFYLAMAIASSLVVFIAFGRTFYFREHFGGGQLSPLVQIHGLVFTVWMLYFIGQTALIASNRGAIHRWLGYSGGVLAVVMVWLGFVVAVRAERRSFSQPGASPDVNFLFSLCDILTFSIFIGCGFIWRRKREAHQRFMLLAVVAGLFDAAPPRLPFIGGHGPAMALVGLSFLFAGPIYDFVSRRRIHAVYIWGCLFSLITGPPVRVMFAHTAEWHRFAKWLVGV